jgi:hypothetical protein
MNSNCPGERSVHFLSLGFSICRVCRNGHFGPINSKLRRNATASSNPTLSAIQSLRRCDDLSDEKPRLNSGLLPRHPRQCRTYCNRRRIPRVNARCAWSCRSIRDTNCLDGDEPTYEIVIPSLGRIELLRVISAYHCRPPDPNGNSNTVLFKRSSTFHFRISLIMTRFVCDSAAKRLAARWRRN